MSEFEKAMHEQEQREREVKAFQAMVKQAVRMDHLWLYSVPITRSSK